MARTPPCRQGAVEQFRRAEPGVLHRERDARRDARKRGRGRLADDLVVVHAEDRDVVRHRQPGRAAGVKHLAGADVVGGEERGRTRQGEKPFLQMSVVLGVPVSVYLEDTAREIAPGDFGGECLLAFDGPLDAAPFADERETERKQKLAESRLRYFGKAEQNLAAAADYAREKDAVLLHTGDLIDFVSEKNFEFVSDFYGQKELVPHFVSSGNHEFSHYLGEAKEDEAYKLQSFDRVQRAFPNDLRFASKVVNGVNFVAFDDVYYYVADDLIERMKAEVEKGLPIVTMCHVPFYTPGLFKFMLEDRKERSAYVTGVPEEAIKAYDQEKNRHQAGNEATQLFVNWLRDQKLVKALLCGHLHVNYEDEFSETARQYVV